MMQLVLQYWSSFFGTRSGRSIGLTALPFALGFHKWTFCWKGRSNVSSLWAPSEFSVMRQYGAEKLIWFRWWNMSRPGPPDGVSTRSGIYFGRDPIRTPPSAETNIYKSMVFMSCFIDLPSCSFWTPFLVILISLNQVSVHSRTAAVKIHLKLHPPHLGRPNQLSMMILLLNVGHVLSPCMSPSRTHIVKTLNDDDAPFHLSPRIGLTTTTSQLLNSSMKRLRYV